MTTSSNPPRWRRRLALLLTRSRGVDRPARWLWLVSLSAMLGAAVALAFLLAIATNNRELYERHYGWLVAVNVGIAAVLVAVFVPTAFMGGIAGQFYKQFALTIASATNISLVVSLSLTPAL